MCNLFSPTLKTMCDSRWNTLNYMIDSVVKNYDKIAEVLSQRESHHRLPPKNILIEVNNFLNLFTEITTRCEASKTPTAHLIWISNHKINEHLTIQRRDLEVIKQMKKAASEYFQKDCFDLTDFNIVAPILYPPMNALSFASANEKDNAFSILRNMMKDIESNNDDGIYIDDESKRKVSNSFMQEYVNCANGDELSRYRQTLVVENDDFDLLKWWSDHRKEYPTLYKIFCKVYSVPATSAASERQFSSAGNIITDKRSSLAPKKAEAILILNNNPDILDICIKSINNK